MKPLVILGTVLAAAVVALTALWGHSDTISAHHNVYLPLVPNTPLMQTVINTQEYAWCADARASTYPGFLSQLRDVNAQYTQRTGIKDVEVPFGDSRCKVRHVMPDGITCNGWAGRIYYANLVVDVEYCWPLGYVDWRTVHGHELGHGVLGLHEQYVDSGSIQCTGRQDTVMDCGSGVRYPTTALDVPRGCAIILTSWCGQAPAQTFHFWNGSRWIFEDGWQFAPNSGCGEWFMPDGRLAWGACDPTWGGRFNALVGIWTQPASTYDPASNTWWSGGLALP